MDAGCAGKLRREKLHSTECAKNYVRVAAMTSRGVSGCRAKPPPVPTAASERGPYRRHQTRSPPRAILTMYTYHFSFSYISLSSCLLCDYISHLCLANCFYYINNNNLQSADS